MFIEKILNDSIGNTDLVVVGSEYCIYPCLRCEQDAASISRFLTPIVEESYMDSIYKKILKLCNNKNLKVSFNDWGLLYKCKSLINKGNVIPVIGRILSRSILDCPWYENIFQSENDKKLLAGLNIDHEAKLSFLKSIGVNEIEINFQISEFVKNVSKEILVTTYLSNRLISVSRNCFSRDLFQDNSTKCDDMFCDNRIDFTLEKKLSRKKQLYEEATEVDKAYFDNMFIQGKAVYKKENLSLSDISPEIYHSVIMDIE